jgi:hypothetical protein
MYLRLKNLRTQRVRRLTDALLLLLSNMPVSMLARANPVAH